MTRARKRAPAGPGGGVTSHESFRVAVVGTALAMVASQPAFGDEAPKADASVAVEPASEPAVVVGEPQATAPAAEAAPATEPEEPPDPSKAWETAPYEHRGGFAVGIVAGVGVGASNGFPADSRKIGRAEFYTESGLGLATNATLWIGGALADWLTFGVGFGYGRIINAETVSPAPTAIFHTDVYPLYSLGGALRNLGVTLDFGLGFASTEDAETEQRLIDAGGASHVFAGVLFEGIEVWKVKMGPFAGVHYLFSETIRRPAAILGFRTTLYTAP